MLTAERLRGLLDYDPETGVFTQRVASHKGRWPAGRVVGSLLNGYVALRIDGERCFAHRLAWLYVFGKWPEHLIDHVNGDRHDNRIANLRDVTVRVNLQNVRAAKPSSKSGLLGAMQVGRRSKRWMSRIRIEGAMVKLGTFDTAEEAHAAYIAAKRRLHEGCTI